MITDDDTIDNIIILHPWHCSATRCRQNAYGQHWSAPGIAPDDVDRLLADLAQSDHSSRITRGESELTELTDLTGQSGHQSGQSGQSEQSPGSVTRL